jgi:DNA-binding response OmpR family regulator
MSINTNIIKILFVDNNSYLSKDFIDAVKDKEKSCNPSVTFQVITARHIEAAIQNMESQTYDVIILDIMLPLDGPKLIKHEELEKERKSLSNQMLKKSNEERVDEITNETARIRRRIDDIDDIIDNEIQDIEGGYNILKKYMENHKLEFYDKPVMFLSARGQWELREKCRIMTEHRCEWLEKPVSNDDIVDKMLKLLNINHNK